MQDHFKWLKKEEGFTKEADEPPGPKLDLAFKAGQVYMLQSADVSIIDTAETSILLMKVFDLAASKMIYGIMY